MGFSASHIEIALRYTNLGQQCQTARVYTWDGAAIAAASAAQVGEAWWNHYKAAWRGLAVAGIAYAQFTSVFVREVGGSLTYGEYAIPTAEQQGNRAGASTDILPSFMAVGVRLTVGTAVTRPGQMRVPFLLEQDSIQQSVQAPFLALCATLAALYSSNNILGAPVATGVLTPVVVRYGTDNNTVLASQNIVGHIENTFTTTQRSRRIGHGA